MSHEIPDPQALTPSYLVRFAHAECAGCTDLKMFGQEIIDAVPTDEDVNIFTVVARFAAFASLCTRSEPVPEPGCGDGPCSTISQDRSCLLRELKTMTPQERLQAARGVAGA